MIIEWMRNNWTNKLYWYQHQNHTISQSSSSMLVIKGNRWMKDAINKRMTGTEPNAIKIGGFSYSTCFCVLPSLETKRHSKVWLHLWSECGCSSVHTGEAFQLYSSSQVKDQVGIVTNISQTLIIDTTNSFLGWGSESLRHLPQFIQLESRRDSTEIWFARLFRKLSLLIPVTFSNLLWGTCTDLEFRPPWLASVLQLALVFIPIEVHFSPKQWAASPKTQIMEKNVATNAYFNSKYFFQTPYIHIYVCACISISFIYSSSSPVCSLSLKTSHSCFHITANDCHTEIVFSGLVPPT